MEDPGGPDRRTAAIIALVVLVVAAVPLAIWGVSSDGGDSGEGDLVVQRAKDPLSGLEEVIVSFEDGNVLNTEKPRDGRSIEVRCFDSKGTAALTTRSEWPPDTDGGELAPHVHLPAEGQRSRDVARCRISGLRRTYEGTLGS